MTIIAKKKKNCISKSRTVSGSSTACEFRIEEGRELASNLIQRFAL